MMAIKRLNNYWLPEYYRLCLQVIGARTVEEIIQVNISQSVDMSQVPCQEERQLESLLRLVRFGEKLSDGMI